MPSMHSQSRIAPTGARHLLKTLSLLTCCVLILSASCASAQQNPQYGSMTACNAMTTGSPTYGSNGGDLNGFVPFVAANSWNSNIQNAPIDPNSPAITAAWAAAGGYKLHATVWFVARRWRHSLYCRRLFANPLRADQCDRLRKRQRCDSGAVSIAGMPSPSRATQPTARAGRILTSADTHTLVLDRHTCWIYETFQTNRCNGLYDAASETIWT